MLRGGPIQRLPHLQAIGICEGAGPEEPELRDHHDSGNSRISEMSQRWSSIIVVCQKTDTLNHVNILTQFAEGTHHEEILPQCLHSEEVKNKVVASYFLGKDWICR